MATTSQSTGYRIGPFVFDLRSGELCRNSRPVRMQEKPRGILIALAERPGELVSRKELRDRLWTEDTFVDFEDGLNTAMRKLRECLGDDPQSPRFIETIRGRGYRLLTEAEPARAEQTTQYPPVSPEVDTSTAVVPSDEAGDAAIEAAGQIAPAPAKYIPSTPLLLWSCAAVFLLALALGGWYWLERSRPALAFGFHDPVLIADFDNQTGDSRFDHALQTALTVSLEQTRYASIFSRLQTGDALHLMHARDDERITAAVGREICQRENIPGLVVPAITRTGQEYLLTAQLIDPVSGATARSYSKKVHAEGQILSALDAISLAIRRDLGESNYRIYRSHRPLPQVTTSSLAALEKYADGSALWDRGKPAQALTLYRAAIADDPGFAMAHAALGSAYYSFYFNETGLGDQEFRKALDLSSRVTDRERALIELSFASAQGRVEESLALYRTYILHYPDDWAVRYGYAHMLRQHGHAVDAIGLYLDLLRESPDSLAVYRELATAYIQTGQWAQSIRAYDKAFSLDPASLATGDTSREYGFTLVRNGEDVKAEQVFSAELADPPSYATGERSLAFLDLYHGRYKSARQRLLLALARSDAPFSVARIRYMLAVIAAGQGDRREQLIQLDRIMANFDALNLKVLFGSLIGQAYARAGEVNKAKDVLTRIAPIVNERMEEQTAYAQLLKAEVAAASGNFRAALEFMKPPQADDSEASAVLTRESLAHIYQEMGDRDEAIIWYRAFAESIGSDALGWEPQQEIFEADYRLASDYQQRGDRGSALNALNRMLEPWRDADPDLPLLEDAIRLRGQLVAAH